MKTHLRSLLRLAAVGAALVAAGALRAESDEQAHTVRTKFSDATKPGTLKFNFPWADVHITGTDDSEIVVTSSLDQKGKGETDAEGFRRLDEDISFEIVEKDNVATLAIAGENPWAAQGAEFTIKVPRNTNLVLRTEAGGDVSVTNLDGDIDINSMNGEIALLDIGSSAIVNTMNGEVTATFRKAPAKPVSITSMNGEVDVRLPGDTKANLRLRTHNGTIRTNFPEGVLVTKTEKNTGAHGYSYAFGNTREQARAAEQLAREQAKLAHADEKLAREHAKLAGQAAPEAPEAPEAAEAAEAPEAPTPHDKHAAAKKTAVQLKDLPPLERARVEAQIARATGDATRNAAQAIANATRALANVPGAVFAGRSPVVGKSITGTLNGGGVDIQLSTMNGTITLRQVK